MRLDDFAHTVRASRSRKLKRQLIRILKRWAKNQDTVSKLDIDVQAVLDEHTDDETISQAWTRFRSSSILYVDGMTMNERLFVFGLLPRWDSCQTDADKLALYRKVHASP